ncbi:roadblock/LC7 domain-containing protein [Allokutzneria multivorans]|uniref:Roadblock/LC7 domain-containing protein n=1 Tax=Allokutzneria multivorans TaxID=1142134 RepID=A0ABP7U3V8_9PSEU
MKHEALTAELRALREQVAGITDTVLGTADGLLILADTADGIDPGGLSALAAAGLGLARRTAEATRQGSLRQTVVHSSGGCTAVYAVGRRALVVVLGDEGLDVERLHQQAQSAIERIDAILSATPPPEHE